MEFKELLKQENCTQSEMAKALDVTQQLVSKWVNGKCTPDPTMILGISKKLKYSSDIILNCFVNKKAPQ